LTQGLLLFRCLPAHGRGKNDIRLAFATEAPGVGGAPPYMLQREAKPLISSTFMSNNLYEEE
jgi:hypothetical protein